jgi:hypothetical protein
LLLELSSRFSHAGGHGGGQRTPSDGYGDVTRTLRDPLLFETGSTLTVYDPAASVWDDRSKLAPQPEFDVTVVAPFINETVTQGNVPVIVLLVTWTTTGS